MRYIMMSKAFELFKEGIKIYRIQTDSITFSKKGKDVTDKWISNEPFKGWKYEDKDYSYGYFQPNATFVKSDKI